MNARKAQYLPPLPKEHPLWPAFKLWVVKGKLHRDIIVDLQAFWPDSNLMWRTFLAGARTGASCRRGIQRRDPRGARR